MFSYALIKLKKHSNLFFPIVKRYEKYYTAKIKGKNVNVSVNSLKPAYFLMIDVNIPDHEVPDK